MIKPPLRLADHDYPRYVEIAQMVLDSQLIRMDQLAIELGFHETTIRSWIREGIFPPPVRFGGWQQFWLRDELVEMQPAIESSWSTTSLRLHVSGIVEGRIRLLDWLIDGMPFERLNGSDDLGWEYECE